MSPAPAISACSGSPRRAACPRACGVSRRWRGSRPSSRCCSPSSACSRRRRCCASVRPNCPSGSPPCSRSDAAPSASLPTCSARWRWERRAAARLQPRPKISVASRLPPAISARCRRATSRGWPRRSCSRSAPAWWRCCRAPTAVPASSSLPPPILPNARRRGGAGAGRVGRSRRQGRWRPAGHGAGGRARREPGRGCLCRHPDTARSRQFRLVSRSMRRIMAAGVVASVACGAGAHAQTASTPRQQARHPKAPAAAAPATPAPPAENLVVHGARRYQSAPVPNQSIHDPAEAAARPRHRSADRPLRPRLHGRQSGAADQPGTERQPEPGLGRGAALRLRRNCGRLCQFLRDANQRRQGSGR